MSVRAQSNSELIAAYLDAVMRKDAPVVEQFFALDVKYMVNGTSSPDRVGPSGPDLEQLLNIAIEVSDALDAAHVACGCDGAMAETHR